MKKILHVTFNMGIGGTESVIRELVNGCTQVEHEILCIDGHIGETGQTLKEAGIAVHCLSRKQGIDLKLMYDIANLTIKRNIDILHCHQYTPFFYGGFAAILAKKQYMLTEHGRHHPDKKRKKAWLINKLLFLKSKSNIVISEATKKALIDFEFCPSKKIKVIYNGISKNTGCLNNKKNPYIFSCIARFDKNKNQASIVKALKILKDKNITVYVDFFGDGPEFDTVKELSKSIGVSEQTNFLGSVSNPAQNLNKYNGLLLSSYTEGTSMVLLEAFREQTLVIATNTGGTPEIVIDAQTGLLFEPNDEKMLARIIESTIEKPDRNEKIVNNAKNFFDELFTSESMSKSYLNEYIK